MTLTFGALCFALALWALCIPAGYVFIFTNILPPDACINPITNSTCIFLSGVGTCTSLILIVLITLALMASFRWHMTPD